MTPRVGLRQRFLGVWCGVLGCVAVVTVSFWDAGLRIYVVLVLAVVAMVFAGVYICFGGRCWNVNHG